MEHIAFMRRCLELAAQGRGFVGNGALVGSVLVRDGKIIAEGFHAGFGKAHAERALLEKFSDKILPTDILYVNLEPCSHHGKTPPCTDILIERGIKTIVYGMQDPDPRVAGKGLQFLKKSGCTIIGPVLRDECARLNRGFISVRTHGRPYLTLHRAFTSDGRTANADGSPLKITNETQDQWTHAFLRARHDAILVGVGTIISDDPQLTTRYIDHTPTLHRIILDPNGRIPLDARVCTPTSSAPTTVILSEDASVTTMEALRKKSVRVISLPTAASRFEWSDLWKAIAEPADDYRGCTSVLIEGGPATWKIFQSSGYVDEEVTLLGPVRL